MKGPLPRATAPPAGRPPVARPTPPPVHSSISLVTIVKDLAHLTWTTAQSTLCPMGRLPAAGAWQNWARTASATPRRVLHPRDLDELVATVRNGRGRRPARPRRGRRSLLHPRGGHRRGAPPPRLAGRVRACRAPAGRHHARHGRRRHPAGRPERPAGRARAGHAQPRRHRQAVDRRRHLDRHARHRRPARRAGHAGRRRPPGHRDGRRRRDVPHAAARAVRAGPPRPGQRRRARRGDPRGRARPSGSRRARSRGRSRPCSSSSTARTAWSRATTTSSSTGSRTRAAR